MNRFNLPDNLVDNLATLIRKTKVRLRRNQSTSSTYQLANPPESEDQPTQRLTPEIDVMADKSLHEFSAPTTANICTGLAVDINGSFDLKPALINMVQASQFCGKGHEDASAHLQHFLEICSTFTIKDVPRDAILLCLFPFSLLGKAKQWFYANKEKNTMWALCSTNFLVKFFPKGKTNALHGKILSFQQQCDETILESMEHFQDYILECPHHGMNN